MPVIVMTSLVTEPFWTC